MSPLDLQTVKMLQKKFDISSVSHIDQVKMPFHETRKI